MLRFREKETGRVRERGEGRRKRERKGERRQSVELNQNHRSLGNTLHDSNMFLNSFICQHSFKYNGSTYSYRHTITRFRIAYI